MSYLTPVPSTPPTRSATHVPATPVLVSAGVSQFLPGLLVWIVPGASLFLAPGVGLLAVLLTAGAARVSTTKLHGPAVARTGLAIGVASAGLGLLLGGFGIVALLLAGITIVAGVAGAVVGRGLTKPS